MDILQNALKALIAKEAVYYALLAIGLNIQFGYAGLLNFGQVGFALVGSFGVAVAVVQLGVSYWIGLICGILAAVVLALLLGIPTLRLRADYLAITTIAAAEILRLVFRTNALNDVTGGTQGLSGFTDDFYALSPFPLTEVYRPLGIQFRGQEVWVLTVGWILVLLCVLLVWLLTRSPWGRVVRSIREDEDAARALGKNVYWYKMQALVLGGVIGALGGVFEATASRSVIPDTYENAVTFFAWAALILGGTARVFGPVIGAMIFWFLFSITAGVLGRLSEGDNPIIPSDIVDAQGIAAIRFVLVGLALILLMKYRPQGIFGDRREVALDAR
jgi:branched-chain amino acid transport system permease protein